jgi:hypothetical protein
MRVFLDACVDPRTAAIFAGHQVRTAFELDWHRLKDNELLPRVAEQFYVLVTIDRGFEHEHNLTRVRLGIVIVHVAKNKVEFYRELAAQLLPNPLLGVTGTNGKTTTTALLGPMFEAAGVEAEVAGNIGRPLTSLVGVAPPQAWVICELSSFQLEDVETLRPHIAVLTNLEPDHLDRHGSFEAYRDTTGPGVTGTRAMLVKARMQAPLKAARDAALIRLMFDLGLRRGEVTGLDLEDFETKERRLWIRGKGRSQKESRTLPETTLASLTTWLDIRSQVVPSTEPAMFIGLAGGVRGRRLTGRGLYHVIAALGAAVGIRTRPHGLRHASITAALDANNGDVRAVQLHARHADPQTTMRYDDNRQDLAGRVATSLANVL